MNKVNIIFIIHHQFCQNIQTMNNNNTKDHIENKKLLKTMTIFWNTLQAKLVRDGDFFNRFAH